MKCLHQKHDGHDGRRKQNIWQQKWNPVGSRQDLNELSDKSGERSEEGGQWCCRKAALTGLAELKFRRHLPENDRRTPPPLLRIIWQWTWLKQWSGTMERERNEKKKWKPGGVWRLCLIFSSPLSLRARGLAREGQAAPLSQYSPFSSCTVGPQAYEVQRKKNWLETD